LQKEVIDRGGLVNLVGLGAVDDEQGATAILVAELDMHHALGVLVGIRIEEHAIDHAEDGRGCANPEH